MKKALFLMVLLALLGMTQLGAQGYEYVPFVREGVKWVYCYTNVGDDYRPADPNLAYGIVYLTLEIKGDTIINGESYKAMHKYYGDAINEENDTIPIYLREEGQIVYGIVPDGKTFPDCPIGNRFEGAYFFEKLYDGKEFILYDFNDPEAYWNAEANNEENMDYYEPLSIDIISIGSNLAKRHVGRMGSQDFYQIEGIGVDASGSGYTLFPFRPMATGVDTYFQLSHVIEDGEIIYKSVNYKAPDPDGYEYVPLVREGVKWINERVEVNNGDTTCYYYTYELKGHYSYPAWDGDGPSGSDEAKACHYYLGSKIDDDNDSIIASLGPDGIFRTSCYYNYALEKISDENRNLIKRMFYVDIDDGETLYFMCHNSPSYAVDLYLRLQLEPTILTSENFMMAEPITIEGYECNRIVYLDEQGKPKAYLVEGIGFDSYDMGDLLTPFTRKPDPTADHQEWCGLSHVVKDGQIIYKGLRYRDNVHVGINEVVTDVPQRQLDGNYYNLMGQPVGKDVPTVPGIYIHQGKKILVR